MQQRQAEQTEAQIIGRHTTSFTTNIFPSAPSFRPAVLPPRGLVTQRLVVSLRDAEVCQVCVSARGRHYHPPATVEESSCLPPLSAAHPEKKLPKGRRKEDLYFLNLCVWGMRMTPNECVFTAKKEEWM